MFGSTEDSEVGEAPKEAQAAQGELTEEALTKHTEEQAPADSQPAVEEDAKSLPSVRSLTTGPGKTVPGGDRGESMAPSQGERPEPLLDFMFQGFMFLFYIFLPT